MANKIPLSSPLSEHNMWRHKEARQMQYSLRRLIGSRIIESADYCNKIIGIPLYT